MNIATEDERSCHIR